MSKSFFGGNPQIAHFSVGVRYRMGPNEGYREQKERRAAQEAKFKELGWSKTPYFQFNVKSEAAKEDARAKATALAAEYAEKAGFELEVSEGCFL
jgi:hypothetical protein